jgi:hypothetical protein
MRVPLPTFLVDYVINKAITTAIRDDTKSTIYGPDGSLYMERYPLVPFNCRWTLGIAVRLHIIFRSDIDKHMHDHPWWNISWLLRGEYFEEVPHGMLNVFRHRARGAIVLRRATARHKLHLIRERGVEQPVYSLFVTGPWQQGWGFYTERGKVPWRLYLLGRDGAAPPLPPNPHTIEPPTPWPR